MMSDNIILNVKTVPAWDSDEMCFHTAYTVYTIINGMYTYSSGWTLKDAIEFYAQQYKFRREVVQIKRPFKNQIVRSIGL
jgi:hypothetical protein